jgi:hypothetical protein
MVKAFENILKQEDTFHVLKEEGTEFHLFANSGEGIYVPGAHGVERAEAVMDQVFDADTSVT